MEKNYKLTIAYKGTDYSGWQVQPQLKTVQGVVKETFKSMFKSEIRLMGSGRTDAGVHALGQVANFKSEISIPPEKLVQALNSNLPRDIRIKECCIMDDEFHSRFSAVGKTYLYYIYNSRVGSPFLKDYSYLIPYRLDFHKMEKAAEGFKGEHDFFGFMSTGSPVKDTVRTIYDIKLQKQNDMIAMEVTGNGFLYNMVRIIAGTLIDVGREKIHAEDIGKIIDSKDRSRGGHTAKANGLFLKKVYYSEDEILKCTSKKTLDTLGALL
ncbi:tRNA pseudouridine38-40 synthase [Dethiosulfatibacter aminovorans DSM 17477]|uniref:tRNA pseudouridine synthase A n=1 Tax=Dethiosulfatibacter aminovorans DSM 17477 TaxID=1121476 RepID=A0A1M6L777_9FIRM|nr:tRNA pseudouridine(38-40) synthase TruA [Dethiosulfatibacter aminovorans]SHJ67040.1 tRNA pseudouridine38-40 synthase [Dethiosulfatibacter aminovorans DSM 17477]